MPWRFSPPKSQVQVSKFEVRRGLQPAEPLRAWPVSYILCPSFRGSPDILGAGLRHLDLVLITHAFDDLRAAAAGTAAPPPYMQFFPPTQ